MGALSVHVSDFVTRLRCLARIRIKYSVCRVRYEHTTPIVFGVSQEFESNLPYVGFGMITDD